MGAWVVSAHAAPPSRTAADTMASGGHSRELLDPLPERDSEGRKRSVEKVR